MKYKYHYIYKTTNLINGKIYIGKRSSNLPCEEDRYFGSGKILRRSVNKNGRENFKKELVEYCDVPNLDEREIFWINKLNSTDINIGYNLTKGGQGKLGLKHTEETKAEGRIRMLEYIKEKGCPSKGSVRKDLSLRNLEGSKSVLQFTENGDFVNKWPSSKEATRKTGINNITFCCDVKLENYNTAGGYIWMWEEDYIEEWLEERISFVKDRYRNLKGISGKDNPEAKEVVKLDKKTMEILDIFDTISDAADSVKSSNWNVSSVCHGKQKTAKGFKWKFVKDLEKGYI